MFQFPPSALEAYFTQPRVTGDFLLPGFPIRTHPGQRSIGSSPDSFVAFSVLLRQHVPRHPSRALSRLSFSLNSQLVFFAYLQISEFSSLLI